MNAILDAYRKAGLSQQDFAARLKAMYDVSHVSDVHDMTLLEVIAGWADDGCPLLAAMGADGGAAQTERALTPDEPHNDDIPL